MNYDKLKDEIQEIAAIAGSVPEPFRQQCFQLLLTKLLESGKPPHSLKAQQEKQDEREAPSKGGGDKVGKIPMPAQLRVFMQKTTVTEEQLRAVLTVEDDEVHFLKEPTPGKIAKGQTQWALLLALKNAITSNTFSVDPEAVRSICQEKGFYDKANFAKNFKQEATAKLFKKPLEPQGDPQALSSDGLTALGQLVKTLAGAS